MQEIRIKLYVMIKNITAIKILSCLIFTSCIVSSNNETLDINLRLRIPLKSDKNEFSVGNKTEKWNAKETAIIICDMWDKHWCKGATRRVEEMADVMEKLITVAREKGVLIVHSPSGCVDYYKDHLAWKLGKKYIDKEVALVHGDSILDTEKGMKWPLDQLNGGCDCDVRCRVRGCMSKQISTININSKDAISDSGEEINGLFKERNIKNVIIMGVHTNMCVIGRSFGLRNMVRFGKNVVLVRDLTDTMYDSKSWPFVSHFEGNNLMIEYIEKYVCPTIVSSDFTGKNKFNFKNNIY